MSVILSYKIVFLLFPFHKVCDTNTVEVHYLRCILYSDRQNEKRWFYKTYKINTTNELCGSVPKQNHKIAVVSPPESFRHSNRHTKTNWQEHAFWNKLYLFCFYCSNKTRNRFRKNNNTNPYIMFCTMFCIYELFHVTCTQIFVCSNFQAHICLVWSYLATWLQASWLIDV